LADTTTLPADTVRPAATDVHQTPEDWFASGIDAELASLAGEAPIQPGSLEEPDTDEQPEPDEPDNDLLGSIDTTDTDQGAGGQPASRTAEEWVETLLTSGTQRLAEVPKRMLAEVTEMYAERRAQDAQRAAVEAVTQAQERERQTRQFVAEVEQQYADDPDGFNAWVRSGDPNAATFVQAKAWLKQLDGAAPGQVAEAIVRLRNDATYQFNRIKDFPEAQQELVRRQKEQQRYPETEAGLRNLSRDVDELLSQYARNASTKQAQPNPRAAAARERLSAPKPDVETPARSAAPSGRDWAQRTNDPNELFQRGVAEAIDAMRQRR
jgi:ElaB/YqjD/DUF883 family membrane-anchored ribosome-binding protein